MTAQGKVTCPWCKRARISLTKRGKIWTHKPTTREFSGEYTDWCAGSSRLPTEWNDLRKQLASLDAPIATRAPNPGSRHARAQGCTCPVVDNNYGMWAPQPPHGWWMVPDCPLHRRKA